jgi:hypothetical protein
MLVPVGETSAKMTHKEIVEGRQDERPSNGGRGAAVLTGIVIDASVALARCFPDEASEYADGVLVALEGRAILVSALWSVEITNAVLMAERRKRVKQPKIRRFVELLDAQTVIMDSQSVTESVSNILPIARE